MATLAAFALPTLSRAVAALIDWFTLLFFSISTLAIWVIWIAMQTGVPAKPAANVAKLAPGFSPSFSLFALLVALAASVAWCSLVWWRASRHRAPIWKSLVLPASGATPGLAAAADVVATLAQLRAQLCTAGAKRGALDEQRAPKAAYKPTA